MSITMASNAMTVKPPMTTCMVLKRHQFTSYRQCVRARRRPAARSQRAASTGQLKVLKPSPSKQPVPALQRRQADATQNQREQDKHRELGPVQHRRSELRPAGARATSDRAVGQRQLDIAGRRAEVDLGRLGRGNPFRRFVATRLSILCSPGSIGNVSSPSSARSVCAAVDRDRRHFRVSRQAQRHVARRACCGIAVPASRRSSACRALMASVTESNASVEPALASGRVADELSCSPPRGSNSATRTSLTSCPVLLSGRPSKVGIPDVADGKAPDFLPGERLVRCQRQR